MLCQPLRPVAHAVGPARCCLGSRLALSVEILTPCNGTRYPVDHRFRGQVGAKTTSSFLVIVLTPLM